MVCKAGRKGSHLYILKGITPDPKPQARIILPLTKVKELTRSENKKGKLLPCKSPESIFATASIILRFKKKKKIMQLLTTAYLNGNSPPLIS